MRRSVGGKLGLLGLWGAAVFVVAVEAWGEGEDGAVKRRTIDTIRTVPLGPGGVGRVSDRRTKDLLARLRRGMRYRRWQVRVDPIPEGADGVFWNIAATSVEGRYGADHPAAELDFVEHAQKIPVMRVPDHLWDEWAEPAMAEVVGIHFHEVLSMDTARMFFTQFAHPPKAKAGRGKQGTRIEGTLLLPVTWWLNQSIVVRSDRNRDLTETRVAHEQGHAANALRDLIRTLGGPGDWDESRLSGQKSVFVWRWRTERVSRKWEGMFGGKKPMLTLRTYIDVLPPTRWTLLTNKGVKAVGNREIKAFNDSLVLIDGRYEKMRAASVVAFHRLVGSHEVDRLPSFEHFPVGLHEGKGR